MNNYVFSSEMILCEKQFLLVFGFFVMILGTYANLGAIDEQQSGTNPIPIDRLPDIHITHPTEHIYITPSNIEEPKKKIVIGPKFNSMTPETNAKLKNLMRKMAKPSQLQRGTTETVREIDLVDKTKSQILPKPNEIQQPVVLTKSDSAPLSSKTNIIKAAQIADGRNVAEQLVTPTSLLKSADSLINNDAIRKEEQEIEINAKEQRQNDVKRTQEILDVVKNQLSKQNAENQRIVLQKINEISDKVNSIAQSQNVERPAQLNVDSLVIDAQTDPSRNKVDELNNQVKPSAENKDEMKNLLLPPVPIAKLLVEQKSSSLPVHVNETAVHSENIPKQENLIIPEKIVQPNNELPHNVEKPIEKPIENVGRDLLSKENK